jgi:hypothetical protein
MSAELWAAVDGLTRPVRQRLERDGGGSEWANMPSLLAQLIEAVQTGAGGSGKGKQESRPPLDIACMSLLLEIAGDIAEACRSFDIKRDFDIEKDLRHLASAVTAVPDNGDEIDWWTERVRRWCGQIRATISSDPDRSWRLHGVPCPDCGTKHVTEQQNGETLRTPVIQVKWVRGLVRYIQCQACEAVWYRGADLEQLAERLLARATTREDVA